MKSRGQRLSAARVTGGDPDGGIYQTALDYAAMRKSKSPITPARVKAYRTFRETRGGSQKHIDQQVGKMERLSEFLKSESMSLDFDTIDKWLQSLDRSPNTLAQYWPNLTEK